MAERHRAFQGRSLARLRLAADDRLVRLIRHGDRAAFEVVYDRHVAGLMSFCRYMLGSRHDAEDAVQATFASAYRALMADKRPVSLRPWLFTIARNCCLSILRRRHPTAELNGEPAPGGDLQHELELREEVRHLLRGVLELPERQRATLVLGELHGLSQAEIGEVLGVRSEQVKAYAYQARANLISERTAREADCGDIREELSIAHGVALRKRRLRRHLRACGGCRSYEEELAFQSEQLAALVPVVPSLAFKLRALQDVFGAAGAGGRVAVGGSVAGTATLAGGGVKALVAKVAGGVAAIGAGAGVGAAVLGGPLMAAGPARPSASVALTGPPVVRTAAGGTAADGGLPTSPQPSGLESVSEAGAAGAGVRSRAPAAGRRERSHATDEASGSTVGAPPGSGEALPAAAPVRRHRTPTGRAGEAGDSMSGAARQHQRERRELKRRRNYGENLRQREERPKPIARPPRRSEEQLLRMREEHRAQREERRRLRKEGKRPARPPRG